MTAIRSTNSAYRGTWKHDSTNRRFVVFYVTGEDAADNRATDTQPKQAGWYWQANGTRTPSRRFQSSRAAWRDARTALAAKSSTVTTEKVLA